MNLLLGAVLAVSVVGNVVQYRKNIRISEEIGAQTERVRGLTDKVERTRRRSIDG